MNRRQAIEVLSAHFQRETNPSRQQFKAWLVALGGEVFFDAFIHAGFELDFVARYGFMEEDLDALGIGREKRGLRRQLLTRFRLEEFFEKEEEESDEEEESEEEEESDEEEED